MQRKPSPHYLHFTRKERTGTLVILFIILLLIAFPFFYSLIFREKVVGTDTIANEMDSLKMRPVDSAKRYSRKNFDENIYHDPYRSTEHNNTVVDGELFYFDPNTLSGAGWKKLGLNNKTIITIQKYVLKGGRFREPEDIKKIWGLSEDLVQRLLPYVKIEAGSSFSNAKPAYEIKKYEEKKANAIIEINQADTTAFISLPGIGPKLSQRIINFRERLGGFYSVDQVGETFGLPDSTFQKIRSKLVIRDKAVKQININTASPDEMKLHPYIRYQLANAIIQYRTQHGDFAKPEDIKNIMMIDEALYNKLFPYLTVQGH